MRRSGPPRKQGKCVVYWMQRAVRAVENPALDVAIEAANILGIPVVIYFGVIPNYPNANLRHYHFLQQGLRDAQEDAAARGIGFIVRRAPDKLEAFLEEVRAALLVGDASARSSAAGRSRSLPQSAWPCHPSTAEWSSRRR